MLLPRQASAEKSEEETISGYEEFYNGALDFIDTIGKVKTASEYGVKILQYLGWLNQPREVTHQDIIDEIGRLGSYYNHTVVTAALGDANVEFNGFQTDLDLYRDDVADGYVDPTSNVGVQFQVRTADGLAKSLSAYGQGALCTKHNMFGMFPKGSDDGPKSYDWRAGMPYAFWGVANRLLAIRLLAPDFRTTHNHDAEINAIRNCLIAHRDTIRITKPLSHCYPADSGPYNSCNRYQCKERRAYDENIVGSFTPQWPTESYVMEVAECSLLSTPTSEREFQDVESYYDSKVDHDKMGSVLFALQRLIDSLYLLTSPNPDPAPISEAGHIAMAGNPALCLGIVNGVPGLADCSSTSDALNWTYDRSTGRIMNASTGQCISADAPPPMTKRPGYDIYFPSTQAIATTLKSCTSDRGNESQIWAWNPESGVISNSWGSALTAIVLTPAASQPIFARPVSSWFVHRQAWTSASMDSCTGTRCLSIGSGAWKQGPISWGSKTQYYPKDFSIFSYYEVNSFRDVAGPIAVNGGYNRDRPGTSDEWATPSTGIQSYSFNLNAVAQNPVALVYAGSAFGEIDGSIGSAGGVMDLRNGTIFYDALVSKPVNINMNLPNVTKRYGDVYREPSPINFETAFFNLMDWSDALNRMPATGTVTIEWGRLMFKTSPQHSGKSLQVFNYDPDDFPSSEIWEYNFEVPSNSTVLINYRSSQAIIRNCNLNGLPAAGKVLWNFPEARRLEVSSVGLKGSILAPKAWTELKWGYINGTVVAASVVGDAEFHWYPFANNALVD